jgi:hypothetical protein
MREGLFKLSSFHILVFLAVLSVFPLFTAFRYPIYLNDDSYITLTYVKNLVNGNGFVFNHPPAVLGTTTPLFTIATAGLAIIFPQSSIPVVSVFFTAFCWLGVVWTLFFFRKAWQLENWHVGVIALVLIGSGWIHFLGMEAYLFAFLLLLSVSLFLDERYYFAGFGVGLLFLTRGEGVLVLFVLVTAALFSDWIEEKSIEIESLRKPLKLAVGFGIPVCLWFVYAQFTFGSFLPNTLAAKQAQRQSTLWRPFLQRLIQEWMPLWGRSFKLGSLPFFNFWWIIVLIGLGDVLIQKQRWLILVGWILLYILGYTILNVSAYWWYQLPILFVLNLLFGLGSVRIVTFLDKAIKSRRVFLGASAIFILTISFVLARPTFEAALNYEGDSRGESYIDLSRWFCDHTAPSASIAYIEIGYLGFYTDNRIIDLAGLVLPDIANHIGDGDFSWGFWHYKPDYYVYRKGFDWALAGIRKDPRFDQQYQLITTLPGPKSASLEIYKLISQ